MSNVNKRIINIIVDKLGVEPYEVTPQASLIGDLGADSLDAVELIMEFEKEFGLSISDDEAEQFRTVGDIMVYLGNGVSSEDSQEISAEVAMFKSILNEYRQKEDEITNDSKSSRRFLSECENLLQGESDFIQASYRFLQALCCLRFTLNVGDSLFAKGYGYITKSIELQDGQEYKTIELMYQMLGVDNDDDDAYEKYKQIADQYYLSEEDTYWIGFEEIRFRYEFLLWERLSSAAIQYSERGNLWKAYQCCQILKACDNNCILIWTYGFVAQLYLREDGLQPQSKGFEVARKVADYDFLGNGEFDAEGVFDQSWRSCIRLVGYCYMYGIGVEQKYDEAFKYTSIAAKYGDEAAMSNLGRCYEYGYGVQIDKTAALNWYKSAIDAGFESAKENYNRLIDETDSPNELTGTQYVAPSSTQNSSHTEENLIDW